METDPPSQLPRKSRKRWLLVVLPALAGYAAAEVLYFSPNYGSVLGFLTDGLFMATATDRAEGQLGLLQSELSLYYGDAEGRYPEKLDELWAGGKYRSGPPPRIDLYADAGFGTKVRRVHPYRGSDAIRYFRSRAEADDSGGWGYVGQPGLAETGTVFVNCTHRHLKRGTPWHLVDAAALRGDKPR